MGNILELRGVCKSFKMFSLDDVSFTVPSGSVCGFVGINGAGKSTTVKIMEGLLKNDAGEVFLFGEKELSPKTKSLIGTFGSVAVLNLLNGLDLEGFAESITNMRPVALVLGLAFLAVTFKIACRLYRNKDL